MFVLSLVFCLELANALSLIVLDGSIKGQEQGDMSLQSVPDLSSWEVCCFTFSIRRKLTLSSCKSSENTLTPQTMTLLSPAENSLTLFKS